MDSKEIKMDSMEINLVKRMDSMELNLVTRMDSMKPNLEHLLVMLDLMYQ